MVANPSAPGDDQVFQELDVDDTGLPSIALVPPGASRDEVYDHIKINHHPLLFLPEGSEDYVGAYWTGTDMVVSDELGPDQDEAIDEFRQYLLDRGQM
jgi:hypothetical protein